MNEKRVDEEWKKQAEEEKVTLSSGNESEELPGASFTGFVTGLASQVLIGLGEVDNPISGKREKSLPQAKYTIDLLDILRSKTKGNLSEAEEKYMDGVLYDLRMRYVQSCA